MIDKTEFEQGKAAASRTADLAKQATIAEILAVGGPDFVSGEGARSAEWHRGWDAAIMEARASAKGGQ